MRSLTYLLLAATAAFFATVSIDAQTISNVVVTDLNPDNSKNVRDRSVQESRTANAGLVSQSDRSFTNQFQFMAGQRYAPGSFRFARIYDVSVNYLLDFTVEDPDNKGYRLDIGTRLRGYATLLGPENFDPDEGNSSMMNFDLLARFDDDLLSDGNDDGDPDDSIVTAFREVDLETSAGSIRPDLTDFAVNERIDNSNEFLSEVYFGTRTFRIRFNDAFLSGFNFNYNNDVELDGTFRFGLTSDVTETDLEAGDILAPLLSAVYPGPDGESASEHGHFVNVRILGIPEPSTGFLFLSGATTLFLMLRRRR